jgi:polyphosphate kinase
MEKYIIEGGIILIKLWLEVGMDEQERRFKARIDDPLRQWKLSPMDTESYRRWYDYSRARDLMFKAAIRNTRHGMSSAPTTSAGRDSTVSRIC